LPRKAFGKGRRKDRVKSLEADLVEATKGAGLTYPGERRSRKRDYRRKRIGEGREERV